MKRFLTFTISMLLLSLGVASAQMADAAVVDYVKSGLAAGKGEKQIGQELLARGVSVEQLERIKNQYENSNSGETISADVQSTSSAAIRRNAVAEDSFVNFGGVADAVPAPTEEGKLERSRSIFGHDIFRSRNLSFEPNMNVPTPENYILGPGDEVVVDVWGDNEANFRQTISPDGRIIISQIGPVNLTGLSITKANDLIKKKFSQKYSGRTNINLTLGTIKTIQVNVFGEVALPGTYRLSSFSNVFHALYNAGGVTDRGTIREIEVIRGGEKIAVIDLYPYLLNGEFSQDFHLQDGDVVRVPLYGMVASIEGKVKRPMFYEMKEGETLQNLITYAGGFEGDAFTNEVSLVRETGRERSIMSIGSDRYAGFRLDAGDAVTVGASLDRFANRIEVRGSVFRPGMYELTAGTSTVKELIAHAEGLKEDAFTERARLLRQREDFTPEVMSVPLGAIMSGMVADIPLKKNDILVIPGIHELKDLGEVTIEGYVSKPGTYTYAENMTVEDLILQAGGLLNGASAMRVDISRRFNDPNATSVNYDFAEEFTFPLDLNLKMDNSIKFELKPYDIIRIRKSPNFRPQANVTISGEVTFPGGYTLLSQKERVSDLVRRAGGTTGNSYLKGAVLYRHVNEEELNLRNSVYRIAAQGGTRDSLDMRKLSQADVYTVGIELDEALRHPGSDYDLVLRDGDRLFIPEYVSTVKISGDVMYPNTVLYKPGAGISHYVDQAGGYGTGAKKSKAYIVYMNGTVSSRKLGAKIEPGCEIIIPSKKEKKATSLAEIMTVSNSVMSMSTIIATLANIFLK